MRQSCRIKPDLFLFKSKGTLGAVFISRATILLPATMDNSEIKQAWQAELERRLTDCSFASPQNGSRSPLSRFSSRLFDHHFRKERNTSVEPPLPGFPRLPLDHRWVELRVQESHYRSGLSLDPLRNQLESIGLRRANQSIKSLLSSTESFLVIGRPGAGKSTLVNWAARFLIQELRGPTIIPMVIPLRSFARWKSDPAHSGGDVYEFFWTRLLGLPERDVEAFRDFMIDVESLSELTGICRVFLDGWDEIPGDSLSHVEDEVERFRFLLPTLATSRPTYSGLSHLPDRRFDIIPLPFLSMRAFNARMVQFRKST